MVVDPIPDQSIRKVVVSVDRPWTAKPGQYVYVSAFGSMFHSFGLPQSHPYLIAWAEANTIVLLVDCYNGFSSRLPADGRFPTSVWIDGPYGNCSDLDDYDKTLFVASGVGVAAHLLTIRQLLKRHQEKKARVRRVTLSWFIEKEGKQVAAPL